jgi:hypothetical protein
MGLKILGHFAPAINDGAIPQYVPDGTSKYLFEI